MRRMSFALTTRQFLDGSKDVTRRVGWNFIKPGDQIIAIEKGMGLKKGEKQKVLGQLEVISNDRVFLNDITESDVIREGFPKMTTREFVDMFCREMRVDPMSIVNRIEFRKCK